MNVIKIKNGIITFNDPSIQKNMEKLADDYFEIFKKTAENSSINPNLKMASFLGLGFLLGLKNKEIKSVFKKLGSGFIDISKNKLSKFNRGD